jgi:hypothetical protein
MEDSGLAVEGSELVSRSAGTFARSRRREVGIAVPGGDQIGAGCRTFNGEHHGRGAGNPTADCSKEPK